MPLTEISLAPAIRARGSSFVAAGPRDDQHGAVRVLGDAMGDRAQQERLERREPARAQHDHGRVVAVRDLEDRGPDAVERDLGDLGLRPETDGGRSCAAFLGDGRSGLQDRLVGVGRNRHGAAVGRCDDRRPGSTRGGRSLAIPGRCLPRSRSRGVIPTSRHSRSGSGQRAPSSRPPGGGSTAPYECPGVGAPRRNRLRHPGYLCAAAPADVWSRMRAGRSWRGHCGPASAELLRPAVGRAALHQCHRVARRAHVARAWRVGSVLAAVATAMPESLIP